MSYVLRRDPVWLKSVPLSDPSGAIGLLSGDDCHVSVPAALLLAVSPLVRDIMAGQCHLPPAYSPPVLSLPAVTGEVLQVVGEMLSKGTAGVKKDRIKEVQQVFEMMRVEALLSCSQFDSISLGLGLDKKVKVEDDIDVLEGSGNSENVKLEIIIKIEKEVDTLDCNLMENVAESLTENSIETEDNSRDLVENVVESIKENTLRQEDKNKDCKLVENVAESIEENTRSPNFGKLFIGRNKSKKVKEGGKTIKVQSLKSFIPCGSKFKRCDVPHTNIQDDPKKNMFTCHICDLAFKHRKDMYCEKKFSRDDTLRKHIQTIHGNKGYSCKFCEKKFKRGDSLLMHIRSIHEKIVFKCHICDETFNCKQSRTRHIRSIHEMIVFKCNLCEQTFHRKGSRDRHMKLIHNY